MAADSGAACQHPDWQARATMHREYETEGGPVTKWTISLEMWCVACLAPMRWLAGASLHEAAVSPLGVEVRLPCYPFAVRQES